MEKTYLPLSFVKDDRRANGTKAKNIAGSTWDYVRNELQCFGIPKKDIPSESWFIKYMLSNDFMIDTVRKNPKGLQTRSIIYTPFNMKQFLDSKFWEIAPKVLQHYGYNEEQILNIFVNKKPDETKGITHNIVTEIRDSHVAALLIDKWIANKQVFRPETTFSKYLIQTDKLYMMPDYLEHLPYDTFYLDLTEASKEIDFGNVHGAFVNITKLFKEEYALNIFILSNDQLMFSYYLILNKENMKEISADLFDESITLDTIPASQQITNVKETKFSAQKIMIMVLQMICYLNVKKPDIQPAPEMRKTYHPRKSGIVKNTYSEVMINEVGVTIGSTITQAEKNASTGSSSSGEGTHRSPVPHMRRAHWHSYWCGSEKDDTKHTELRWIEPTFVGNVTNDVKNVTIHPVKQ